MASERDSKGRLQKGHSLNQVRKTKLDVNQGGRKPLPSTEVKHWLSENAPKALQKLFDLCETGDRAACEYIADREWGRSRQSLDLGGDTVEKLGDLLSEMKSNRGT